MFYDISLLWVWLAIVAVIGAAIAWRNEGEGLQGPWFMGWFRVAVIVWGVGVVVALLGLLRGRAGFWRETAVLFFAVYVIGCLAGGAIKRLRA
jgi:hypothetical protein